MDHNGISQSSISDKYIGIYDNTYRDEAKKKRNNLLYSMTDFLKAVDYFPETFNAEVSSTRLNHAVYSYFMDVIRYKEFHFESQSKKINKYKIAAFTAKWLLKVKPIFILVPKDYETSDEENSEIILINEQFCFIHILDFLDIDPEKVDPDMQNDLIYHLHFRNYDESTFFMLLEAIDKSITSS